MRIFFLIPHPLQVAVKRPGLSQGAHKFPNQTKGFTAGCSIRVLALGWSFLVTVGVLEWSCSGAVKLFSIKTNRLWALGVVVALAG